MKLRGSRRPGGFTLAELLVTVAVTAMAIAGVLAVFTSQHRAYEGMEVSRAAQEGARDALAHLERSLRRAGFGVEPRHAFDFRYYRPEAKSGVGGRQIYRDRVDAPDVLSFVSRDPTYRIDQNGENGCTDAGGCPRGNAWRVTDIVGLTSNTPIVTLEARGPLKLFKGQIIQFVCPSGERSTMGTVSVSASTTAAGLLAVTLQRNTTLPDDPYAQADLANGCYLRPGTFAFLIERSYYHVRHFPHLGSTGEFHLMLDRGLDLNGDGTIDEKDELPVAAGVENMQVAYVMYRSPIAAVVAAPDPAASDSNRNWVVGDDRSALAEEPNLTAQAPDYTATVLDARRLTLHPANVRAVRVSLTLRSSRPDPAPPAGWCGDDIPLFENFRLPSGHDPCEGLGRYRRSTAQTTVQVRNLDSRSMFGL